jgi:hypothetical protein
VVSTPPGATTKFYRNPKSFLYIVKRLFENLFIGLLFMGSVMLAFSCGTGEPKIGESDKRFAALYADLLLVQADADRHKDSLAQKQLWMKFSKTDSLQKIFAQHHTAPKEFEEMLNGYLSNPAQWQKVQEYTISLLEAQRQREVDRQNGGVKDSLLR